VIGWLPTHSPRLAVRRLPTVAEPEIVGSRVFAGLADCTTLVGFEVAIAEPSAFVAITCIRIRKPASAWRSV
jgi:hypothetical protein